VKPMTVVVSVPVGDLERTLRFYRDGLGLDTPGVDERMIVVELPNPSSHWCNRPMPVWNDSSIVQRRPATLTSRCSGTRRGE
jgi:hypothetical protein